MQVIGSLGAKRWHEMSVLTQIPLRFVVLPHTIALGELKPSTGLEWGKQGPGGRTFPMEKQLEGVHGV